MSTKKRSRCSENTPRNILTVPGLQRQCFILGVMQRITADIQRQSVVSDGYSTDGTYEVIKKISNLNPKVKVYRCKWPDKKDITVLADVTNEVRNRCRFQYVLSVQANEIIHEQSAPFIKALPSMLPNVSTFSFPYLQLLNKYKIAEEFRLRFAKNLPQFVAIGDAWTMGTSRAFDRTKKLQCLIKPYRILRYVSNGLSLEYANPCYGPLSRAVYLPNPDYEVRVTVSYTFRPATPLVSFLLPGGQIILRSQTSMETEE